MCILIARAGNQNGEKRGPADGLTVLASLTIGLVGWRDESSGRDVVQVWSVDAVDLMPLKV